MPTKKPKKKKERKINIEDVEDALEDERSIMKMKMKNKNFNASKTPDDVDHDDLFTVDTKGSFEGISQTSRRQLARAKLFPPKGPNLGLTWTEEMKITKAERQVEAKERPAKAAAPEVFDLWGAAPPNGKARTNAIGGHTEGYRVRAAKPMRVNVPGTMHQKVGLAPAVIPAHEGQSMNPHREAYEDLACMAAAAEIERERDLEELDRKIKPMSAELRDAVGDEKFRQMSEEEKFAAFKKLHSKREASAREAKEADEEAAAAEEEAGLSGRKRSKQKSQALRNKKKKRVGLDATEEQANAQRRLDKSVGEVGSMLKSMQDDATFHKNRKQYRESLREKRRHLEATEGVVPKKRKLGGGRFAEDATVVPDAEALGGSLRATPLRASAVRDRLTSVVRRGLLPPPNEASKERKNWHKKKNNRLKNGRKFLSPLAKDNLLLR